MQQHSREILKDITTALQLEQELQLSQAQHGVAVLDVYSSEWGNTRALSDAFRRLYTDAGDQIHLRFYSVECNSVLESLNFPAEQRNLQRPKNLELCRETLPTFWEGMLSGRRGKSKSFFIFYKEGKQRAFIEGVNTPKIVSYVKDLCRIQKPASECTSNAELLKFWEYHFSAAESEVFFESFVRAVQEHSAGKLSLTEKEERILAEAIGAKDSKVSVEALDKWMGENETIQGAFTKLFPFLMENGTPAAATAAADGKNFVEGKPGSFVAEERVFGDEMELPKASWESFENFMPELWRRIAALPLHCPSNTRLVLLSCEKGEAEAKEYLQRANDVPTLNQYLTDMGLLAEDIQIMCSSAAEKISSQSLSYGKLALVLMLCDKDRCEELLGRPEALFDQLEDGTLLSQHFPLAYTVICLCTSEANADESFYYCNDANTVESADTLKEGDELVLPPFSRLCAKNAAEGAFTMKFLGIPHVIGLAATNPAGEGVVLTPWYAKFHVTGREENAITLTFAGNVEEEQFRQSVQLYTERVMAEEENLAKVAGIVNVIEHPLGYEQQPDPLSITDPHLVENDAPSEIAPHQEDVAELDAPDDGGEISEADVAKAGANDDQNGDEEL
ncbi:hypothetical protein MOQ_007803 [Trypanosoma cruzi marinkellei]|uniref:Uncharacterized protein n=1 Tax=Trypanosoma cruzi marinkellei TaxID=85056 RepID=K2M0G6_TRYCR|nr:hypothetical protein MOQ_007803 [Trypanosoma cruzi marinkellei]